MLTFVITLILIQEIQSQSFEARARFYHDAIFIQINFTSVVPEFINYGFTLKNANGSVAFTSASGTEVEMNQTYSHTFTGLSSSTEYRIAYLYNNGTNLTITFIKLFTAPESPIITFDQQTSSSVRLTFGSNTATTGYLACLFLTESESCNFASLSSDSKIYSSLTPSGNYTFNVYAQFQTSYSTMASIEGIYTGPSMPNASIIKQMSDELQINFTETSFTTNFKVCLYLSSSGSCTPALETSPKSYGSLQPSGNYTIEIFGIYQNIVGESLIIGPVYTAPAKPTIVIANRTESNVTVEFVENSETDKFQSCIYENGTTACTPTDVRSPKVYETNSTQTYIIRLKAIYQGLESDIAEKSTDDDGLQTTTQETGTTESSANSLTAGILLLGLLLFFH